MSLSPLAERFPSSVSLCRRQIQTSPTLSRFFDTAYSLHQLSWVLDRSSFVAWPSLLTPVTSLSSRSCFTLTYDLLLLASFSRPLVRFKAPPLYSSSLFCFLFFFYFLLPQENHARGEPLSYSLRPSINTKSNGRKNLIFLKKAAVLHRSRSI